MSGPQTETEPDFQRTIEAEAPAGYARWTSREQCHATIGEMTLAAASAWFNDIPADAAARILTSPQPPTLVLGGAEDILSGVDPVRAYAKALAARLAFLPDCGHYPWIEQPEAFVRILDGWLQDSTVD